MSLPQTPPLNFLEAYYENCAERELYNDTVLSQSEYWEIWTKMTEHEESRK